MAAPQVFLVDRLVTAPAIPGCQLRRNDEAVMVFLRLAVRWLMAVQAVDALLRVTAQLVLVDDRVLLLAVALGTLAGRPHECGRRLIGCQRRSNAAHGSARTVAQLEAIARAAGRPPRQRTTTYGAVAATG